MLLSTSHAGAPGALGAVPPQVHPTPQRPASEPLGAIALPVTFINLKTNGAWAPCGGGLSETSCVEATGPWGPGIFPKSKRPKAAGPWDSRAGGRRSK